MRRIIRRTATIVSVQTWTVTWAEEDTPAQLPETAAPAQPGSNLPGTPALLGGPESDTATRLEADTPPAPAGEAPVIPGVD